jgi:type III pantothenate kinase
MDAVLAIDAGNTRIKWGVYQDSWLGHGAFAHDEISTLPELCGRFAVKHVVASNVAGADVRLALQKQFGAIGLEALWVVASEKSCGVTNTYKVPHKLGSDRWAALIAAWHLKRAACVVVNAGTAITVDALSSQGIFMGGLILPGLKLIQDSLAANTAELERVSGTLSIFPQDTGDAMASGAMQATSGAVVQMYQTLAEHEAAKPCLLLSGGDAPTLHSFLAGKVPVEREIAEHLVLNGLLLIYEESVL